jgi:hypothetical protein
MPALNPQQVEPGPGVARTRARALKALRRPDVLWAGICAAGLGAHAALVLWNPAGYRWDLARLLGHGVRPAAGHPLWLAVDYWNWLVLLAVWLSEITSTARWTRNDRPARA